MSLLDKMKKTEGAGAGQAAALMERMLNDQRDPNTVHLMRDQIIVEEQARKDLGDLQAIANSMKEHGQMNAVVVVPTDNPHVFKLAKGARRYFAAFDILGWDTIRAYKDLSGVENDRIKFRIGQLHENIQRKDYEPFELAHEFSDLLNETGWSNRELAQHVQVSESWVSRKLSLLKAPPEIQAAIKSGELAETDYYNNKEETTKATKRTKPSDGEGGDGGASGGAAVKMPKKFSMSWTEATSLADLLVGFVREKHPGEFADLSITRDSSPIEVQAFFDAVKNIWYPQ